jgi:DNA processing protein
VRKPDPETDADFFAHAPLPIAVLTDAQRLACLRLIRTENVGPVTFRQLINTYGGAEAALQALPNLAVLAGRKRPVRICPADQAEAELEAAARCGARPLFTIEPGYPPLLAHIDVAPPLLYVRGSTELFARPTVAIVGSRQASAAGIKMARDLASDLGRAGVVVVSGLARGIDAAAHQSSLATGTVAVLAGGLDVIYPPENAALHEAIGAQGCLLTELPPGFQPRAQDFPRRNRLISGVSQGVVVVEAARRSGTLITARYAAEQSRDVFAIPGHPLDPRAEGTNQLLKDGAIFTTSAEDVLRALAPIAGQPVPFEPPREQHREQRPEVAPPPWLREPPARSPTAPPSLGDADRTAVTDALGPAPVAVDDIVRATGLSIRAVQIVLMELSLTGRLEHHGSQLVSLRPASGRS